MDTPVVLLVFNRPDLVVRLLERLREVAPRRVYVVCDGPRASRPGEADRVREVRALLERFSWPCEVERNYAETNLGCAARVSSGISWALERVGEAIILEDDCLPDLSFFRFAGELLERFREDARVGSICASNLCPQEVSGPESYWFSRYSFIWGWATWRRAWALFDHGMTPLTDGSLDAVLGRVFPTLRPRLYWRFVLRRTFAGRVNSWAYRWQLSCWKHGLLGVVPRQNMVANTGFNEAASNTSFDIYNLARPSPMGFPLRHPVQVAADSRLDGAVEDHVFSRAPAQRLRWMMRALARRITR